MFGMQFNIGATREALRRAMDQLEDMTPIYADVREYMVNATKERFKKGVSPDGVAWAPKRPSTIERYKRLGYGSLTRALIGPGRALSRQVQGIATKSHVEIGSSLIYAGVMQYGAAKGAFGADRRGRPIPWGRIPARTWLGISNADELAIVEIVEEHLAADLDS